MEGSNIGVENLRDRTVETLQEYTRPILSQELRQQLKISYDLRKHMPVVSISKAEG